MQSQAFQEDVCWYVGTQLVPLIDPLSQLVPRPIAYDPEVSPLTHTCLCFCLCVHSLAPRDARRNVSATMI
jgi:hypothetical protein